MTILDLLILSLATWRLAYMLTNEEGPGGVFRWLQKDARWPRAFGWLHGVFGCTFCMSVWTGMLSVALYKLSLSIILLPFAVSAGGLMLSSWTGVEVADYFGDSSGSG